MPGFLGGSSGSSGTGGEITFPKEFIDPVTKLRVSQPENLIDTDFEYGLQPTKWETVELINNTPSFFSKSGDTTIPGIVSIATNNGTREITVITATDHGLAVGIPINVTGTKSVTADGSYVINSIPNVTTFTYLCKDEQSGNNSIQDLYTSIITGEFFQGSQIRIANSEGITTDAEAISTLTVKTDSTHGFGLNTPFYFLNLNSTISQEFEASNTAAKSFDSSNSATAQTFDGSNTLSTFNIDWSNSATIGGVASTISAVSTSNDTITVAHGAETFANQPLGTPLYYNLTEAASSGYFLSNPKGVVFLKTTDALNSPANQSTFQVSAVPDGDAIDIVSNMSGTFQLANQARTFAGNNVNPVNQTLFTVIKNQAFTFEGNNDRSIGGNGLCTQVSYSGSLVNVSVTAGAGLDLYTGAMVFYETTGSPATGLTDDTTYFIDSFFSTGANTFAFTIKALPTDASPITISGGTGVQTFRRIGVSLDKDIVHLKNSNLAAKDMVEYQYPVGGAFGTGDPKNYYFIATAYDAHNYALNAVVESFIASTGGQVRTTVAFNSRPYTVLRWTTAGTYTLNITDAGTFNQAIRYVVNNGSYDGNSSAAYLEGSVAASTGNKTIVVNAGGRVDIAYPQDGLANLIPYATISPSPMSASGGSTSTITVGSIDYRLHQFTSVGATAFTVASLANFSEGNTVEYLVVAGGGAGEQDVAAGGGAGGLLQGSFTATAQSYAVTVGAGATTSGANGSNSNLGASIVAIGGGGAGNWSGNNGKAGGSGGGGAGGNGSLGTGAAGVAGPPRQGFNGANGTPNTSYGGGGGGAGGNASAQDGGAGVSSSITGTARFYAGGGGGGSDNRAGNGGSGIGGRGSLRGQAPESGQPNTGSGGGGHGCCGAGGNGGTGVVIVRYRITPPAGSGG
jgi:hypothetical protein